MPVSGLKRKRITITIPVPAYDSLQALVAESGLTVPNYVRRLVMHHLWDLEIKNQRDKP